MWVRVPLGVLTKRKGYIMFLLKFSEEVDAAVFTGDDLHCEETLKEFENYVDSWKREIQRFKKVNIQIALTEDQKK